MPLPKPPAKRASLLSTDDFVATSAARHGKRNGKARPEPTAPALLELYDSSAPVAAVAVAVGFE